MSHDSYEKEWFILPYHIRKLPGMTLALLDFYETIFEFWNRGRPCFLSNSKLMERTGIKSLTTIHEAFVYFEKHKVLERTFKNGKRTITRVLSVETNEEETTPEEEKSPVDKSEKSSTNFDRGTSAVVGGHTSAVVGGGTTGVAHKINNLNLKNLNKSSSLLKNEKAVDKWGKPIPSGYVDRDTQSTEAKEAKRGDVKTAEFYLSKLKGIPPLKRYRET